MNDDCDIVVAADGFGGFTAAARSDSIRRARLIDSRRFTLMIHGWNVPEPVKLSDYRRLRGRIAVESDAVARSILRVSWPSDRGLHSYPAVLKTVGPVADALTTLLREPSLPFCRAREVVLIGHSMGCRVALEAADRLRAAPEFPEVRVFLMAAAVPTRHVKPQGLLGAAVAWLKRANVYYSGKDRALGPVFSTGQTLAGGVEGGFPEAVGRRGEPREVWGWHRYERRGYGHGRYWTCNTVARHLVEDHRRREIRVLPALE